MNQIRYNAFNALLTQRYNGSFMERKNQKNSFPASLPMDTVSFSGLTHKMKTHTYIDGQKDIKEIVQQRGDKNLIVGHLPKFILEKLPEENKKDAIFEIYNTFSEITEDLRNFDETKVYTIDEITKRRNNATVKKLEDVLRKYNIVGKWDDVDLEYLGKGGKGAGYKIVGLRDNKNDDEFIIKVFHVIEGKDWQPYKSHGCYAEINSAQYWITNVGTNTNRGKFYWGDLRSGYMINKFVDDDVRLPEQIVDPYEYGLKCTDEDAKKKHNVCKGYSFDWGGVRVVNRLKNGDKYARKILKEIKNTPENERSAKWFKLLAKKDGNRESREAGLAMSIKYLEDKNKYFDICLKLNKPKVNQGLAYALKYLPYKDAINYFEKLVQTDDVVTQIVLFNEIPLLAMKHRDNNIKDDLQTTRSEILCSRVKKYYDIAEQYALPESIEHLASFTHLLPKEDFRHYYKRLAEIDNEALQDRMVYKISNVDSENRFYALKQLATRVEDKRHQEKIYGLAMLLPADEAEQIKSILKNKQLDS